MIADNPWIGGEKEIGLSVSRHGKCVKMMPCRLNCNTSPETDTHRAFSVFPERQQGPTATKIPSWRGAPRPQGINAVVLSLKHIWMGLPRALA
jgi:hypothetical protein